jgi:hypothetical protein
MGMSITRFGFSRQPDRVSDKDRKLLMGHVVHEAHCLGFYMGPTASAINRYLTCVELKSLK